MLKKFRLFILVCLLFLSACTKTKITGKEQISDNAVIIEKEIKGFKMYDISYTWQGKNYSNYFDQRYRKSLDWIKENLNPNDKIMCWWDYGHMIRGYTGIDVVIYAPSKDILETVANKKGPKDLMPSEIVHDVANALVTDNHKETIDIMRKYNANYLFITQSEESTGNIIASIVGKKLNDNSIIIRAIRRGEIPGFLIAYEDENVIIYKLR